MSGSSNGSNGSTTGTTSPSLTTILESVDWSTLPPKSRSTARKFGPMLISGFTLREIGRFYGRSEDWASERVKQLRADILEQLTTNS